MPTAPSAAVSRLVTYLRVLERLKSDGVKETSSRYLANQAQVTAFQVRKDLTRFGSFGRRGTGYEVDGLEEKLRAILGLDRQWRVAIVGMGRLGQAIAHYPNFEQYQFRLTALFDVDPQKVGTDVAGIEVAHIDELATVTRERSLSIGFVTVPQAAAQQAADALVAAGVRGILNFAPTVINAPEGVHVEAVDFLAGLSRLSFYIQPRGEEEPL